MVEYIQAIKRGFRDVYNFQPQGGTEQEPTFSSIPDGEYPMQINGAIDNVVIKDGKIFINPTMPLQHPIK